MAVLSVHKLCSKRSSTTSTKTKADIVGRFTVVSLGEDDNNKRRRGGTILLTDLSTHDSLYCRVDLFHHDLVNTAVSITRWNYIKPDYTIKNDAADNSNNMTTAWIEVYLDDVYPLGNPTTSMLQQFLNADKIANELLASIPDIDLVSIPDLLQPIKRSLEEQQQPPIHVLGRVSAKPVRHLERYEIARFYIELVGFRGDTSSIMVFEGDDLMPWYHTFQTDSWHVFMYVAPADTQLDGQLGRGALVFISGISRCYRVDADQFERINLRVLSLDNVVQEAGEREEEEASTQEEEQQCQFFQPSAILRPAESTSISTYSGTITRVIDPAFGVYELDTQLITCLFHYTDYSLVYPFRLGMQIKISCAHMLAVDTGSAIMQAWEAPAVERGDYKTHVILVGCRRTHIRIISFPKHVRYPSTTTTAAKKALSLYGRIYKECIQTRADFDTLLQKLEMQVALTSKFKKGIPAARLRKLCANATRKIKPKTPFGSIYKDVFHHDQSCSAVKTRESTLKLKKFPYVCDVATVLLEDEERTLQLSRHAGATGTSREDQRVDLTMAAYDAAESDLTMIGVVDAMPDGRLYLLDDTGKLPLVVLPENSIRRRQLQLGDVYQIQRFQLVKEDLDYQEEDGSHVLLDCTYIVCAVDDLKRVAVVESANRKSLVLPEVVDTRKVTGFKRERVEVVVDGEDAEQQDEAPYPSLLLYVLDIQPPILSHKDKAFELNSHVRAIRYPVGSEEDNNNKKKPEEVDIIFTSRTQSLRYLPQLRAGCWIGLGANIDEFQRVESAKYLPDKIKMPIALPPTLIIDLDRHYIFTTSPSKYSVAISPTTIGSVPANIKTVIASTKKERIYQVKDILPTTRNPKKAKLLVTESDDDDDDEDEGPSMVEVGQRFFQDTVNVQGVIVSKGFRNQQSRARATIDANTRHVFEEFGVGTGQSGRNQLFFRLRQTDGLDTVDIYMDVWNRTYPLGLIPGALVTFYNLVRKRSDQGIVHCQMLPCTSAAVSEQLDPRTETIFTEQIPQKKLGDITRKTGSSGNNNNNSHEMDPTVFKVPCTVKSVSFVSMAWICGECGTGIEKNKCYRLCKTAKRLFTAYAVATVSDGTSQARANFDGDRLVFKLLNIQESQVDGIKTAVLEHGKVTYQHFGNQGHDEDDDGDDDDEDNNNNNGRNGGGEEEEEEGKQAQVLSGQLTLPKLCRRVMSTGKVFMLFAREIGERPQKDATVMQQLKIRAVMEEDGQAVAVVDRPRIVAVELEPLDPADCAWEMLMQLQQRQQQQQQHQKEEENEKQQ